jgi:cell division protein FtsB
MATARAAARPRARPKTKARPRTRENSRGRSRGRSARRQTAGIRWDRVARTTLLVVLLAVLISFLGPATKYVRTWQLARETRGEVRSLRDDNALLRQEAKRLKDPQQIELRARQLGMARPGERVYVVRGLPKEPPKSSGER